MVLLYSFLFVYLLLKISANIELYIGQLFLSLVVLRSYLFIS